MNAEPAVGASHLPVPASTDFAHVVTVSVIGAAQTGKTALIQDLSRKCLDLGLQAVVVGDLCSAWCSRHGRAPQLQECVLLVHEQARLIRMACASITQNKAVVLCDSSPLTTGVQAFQTVQAIHGDPGLKDPTLYAFGIRQQQSLGLTLLMGRDGHTHAGHSRLDEANYVVEVDTRLRQALSDHHIPYNVLYGSATTRSQQAMALIQNRLGGRVTNPASSPKTLQTQLGSCDKCSDPLCEHRLFTSLLKTA